MVGTAGRSGRLGSLGTDTTPGDGGPIKPEDLPRPVAEKWDQLIDQLPQRSLRQIDAFELKLLSELLAMADNLASTMLADPTDHKTGRLFLNTTDRIHRLSASFGLNPGDRKRLDLPGDDKDEDNPITELLSRLQSVQ